MTPFVTALSRVWTVLARAARASSRAPDSRAPRTALTAVRTLDRTAAFRVRRRSLWRIRLSADLMFAINSPPRTPDRSVRAPGGRPARTRTRTLPWPFCPVKARDRGPHGRGQDRGPASRPVTPRATIGAIARPSVDGRATRDGTVMLEGPDPLEGPPPGSGAVGPGRGGHRAVARAAAVVG